MQGRIALQLRKRSRVRHCVPNQKRFPFDFAEVLAAYDCPRAAFGDSICSFISAVVGGDLFGRGNEKWRRPPARWPRLCR